MLAADDSFDVSPMLQLETFLFCSDPPYFSESDRFMTPNRQIQKRPIFDGESQYVEAAAGATTRKLHCCMILRLVSGPAHEPA